MGLIWEEITDEPTIVVVLFSHKYMNAYYGTDITEDYYQVTRYHNKVPDGISINLKELKGEFKTIVNETIKANNEKHNP